MPDELSNNIPSLGVIEGRFDYIANETLRSNVAIYTRHIIFLLAISEEENLGSLLYCLYKDIIIFTASVVEGVLEYATRRHVLEGRAKEDVFGQAKKYSEIGVVRHDCDEVRGSTLVVAEKKKVYKYNSGDEITFNDIIKAANNANILDQQTSKKADNLRAMRNKIHLQTIKSSEDLFSKKDVQKALEYAKVILSAAENKIKDLS